MPSSLHDSGQTGAALLKFEAIWWKVLMPDERVEVEYPVSDRYRKRGFLIYGVLLAVPTLILFGLGILYFLVAAVYYRYYLRVHRAYAFTNKRVLVHSGWIHKKLISVEYGRITDTTVEQRFLHRLTGGMVGNLLINTAGSQTHEARLEHLDDPYEAKKRLDAIRGPSR